MGLLDTLRNLIRGQKPAMLEDTTQFNKTDLDKTVPFITIDAIRSLINNEAVFDRFMHFDQNQEYFKDLTPDFIARAVKTYVDFMNDKGAKFDRKTQKRIDKIEKLIPKEEQSASYPFKQYGDVNKTELYNAAISIVTSEEQLFKFLDSNSGGEYWGIPKDIISDYISTELKDFTRRIASSEQIERSISFIKNKQFLVSDNTYTVNPNIRLNPEFENSVFQEIQARDPAGFALELYNALNKRVKYNPAFFGLDQDLKDQFARDIYYKPFEQTTNQDNSVVCKQWSELYAHMLQRCGYEAYVVGKGKHKSVRAFFGTTMIEADATNQTTSPDDPSRLTDLTRSKLGVRPAGFKAVDLYGDTQVTKNLQTIRLNYDIDEMVHNEGTIEQVTELMNHIHDERNLTGLLMGLNDPGSTKGNVMKKLGFISDMLKGSNLDNMDSVGYLNHMFHCFLTPDELRIAKTTNAFYEKLYSNDCNMVPIISLNAAEDPSRANPEDYLYFVFDQEKHVLEPITRQELIDKVVSGQLIQGRGKEDKVKIPGVPEITDKDFILERRRMQSQEKMYRDMYGATERTAGTVYGTQRTDEEEGR